jgi:hypothetical protein
VEYIDFDTGPERSVSNYSSSWTSAGHYELVLQLLHLFLQAPNLVCFWSFAGLLSLAFPFSAAGCMCARRFVVNTIRTPRLLPVALDFTRVAKIAGLVEVLATLTNATSKFYLSWSIISLHCAAERG